MSKHVRGVNPDIDAESAWVYMQTSKVRHLVVVDGNAVVGVLSERDLGGSNGSVLRAQRTVRDLMTPHALALTPETDVSDAAKLLRGMAIGCFPVMTGKDLVGIITTSDLLDIVATKFPGKGDARGED
ncbi:MAG: CBS domain-containing protein [Kofleriaceae bacterium]